MKQSQGGMAVCKVLLWEESLLRVHFFSDQLVEAFINPRCTELRRWLETHSAGKMARAI